MMRAGVEVGSLTGRERRRREKSRGREEERGRRESGVRSEVCGSDEE
jgi:hypothetical protein